ncbi:MAG: PIG-L family deacetylase [Opitutales bacterium]|nr:PIG-L family deacetylase [Opitutales bacterium]MBQ2721975.1 PIG-L family deacetylase [Opitutales bacterium]
MKKRVLVLAPHNDDETLGVGATMAKHVANGDEVFVSVLTSIDENNPVMKPNKPEIRAETKQAMEILGVNYNNVIYRDLPNVLLNDEPMYKVNKVVVDVVKEVGPDVLYIPFINDLHKDHREIVYAAQVAARTCTDFGRNIKEVMMYETLSETHWNIESVEGGFLPNVFNEIYDFLDLKLQAVQAYKSQLKFFPDVRSVEALRSLAIVRGAIVGMRAAEGFMLVRKLSY